VNKKFLNKFNTNILFPQRHIPPIEATPRHATVSAELPALAWNWKRYRPTLSTFSTSQSSERGAVGVRSGWRSAATSPRLPRHSSRADNSTVKTHGAEFDENQPERTLNVTSRLLVHYIIILELRAATHMSERNGLTMQQIIA